MSLVNSVLTTLLIIMLLSRVTYALYSKQIAGSRWLNPASNRRWSLASSLPSLMNRFIYSSSLQSTDNSDDNMEKINLAGFKSEVDRAVYRTFKKVNKAKEKLSKTRQQVQDIARSDDDTGKSEMKDIGIDELEIVAMGHEENLKILRSIDSDLKSIKSSSDPTLSKLFREASKLGVSDRPPPKPERGPKRAKGKTPPPRKPYHVYTSKDGISIRVGRQNTDNDELSCNVEHRDSADWWLHVSGSAGSHVIIRSHDDHLQENHPQTVKDAALLAVVNSKGAKRGKVSVNLCRARNVSKPAGAKPGLVRLNGDIYDVVVDANTDKSKESLKRLEETKNSDQAS
jgi:predicted ribosome quality control (RQC) complex YloA/Tae2 family protein